MWFSNTTLMFSQLPTCLWVYFTPCAWSGRKIDVQIRKCVPTKRNREKNYAFQKHFTTGFIKRFSEKYNVIRKWCALSAFTILARAFCDRCIMYYSLRRVQTKSRFFAYAVRIALMILRTTTVQSMDYPTLATRLEGSHQSLIHAFLCRLISGMKRSMERRPRSRIMWRKKTWWYSRPGRSWNSSTSRSSTTTNGKKMRFSSWNCLHLSTRTCPSRWESKVSRRSP